MRSLSMLLMWMIMTSLDCYKTNMQKKARDKKNKKWTWSKLNIKRSKRR